MQAALFFEAEKYQVGAEFSADLSAEATGRRNFVEGGSASGSISTRWDTSLGPRTGIGISYATTRNGAGGSWEVACSAATLGFSDTQGGDAYESLLSAYLTFLGLKIYALSSQVYRLIASSWTYEVNGSTIHTGGAVDVTGTIGAPCGVPILGAEGPTLTLASSPGFTADAAIDWDTEFIYGYATDPDTGEVTPILPPSGLGYLPYDVVATANASISGGARFDQGDGWQAMPAGLPSIPGYQGGIEVSDTWDATLSQTKSEHYWRVVTTALASRSCGPGNFQWYYAKRDKQEIVETGASLLTLPSILASSIERMETGTMLSYYRGGLCKTQGFWGSKPYTSELGDDTSGIVQVHPSVSEFLGVLRDEPHAGEDVFAYPCSAPYAAGSTHSSGDVPFLGQQEDCGVFSVALNPDEWTCPSDGYPGFDPCAALPDFVFPISGYDSSHFPYSVETRGANPDILFALASGDAIMRYVNCWLSPLWSFYGWFEPWEVDGAPVSVPLYWQRLREQLAANDALPEGDATHTRNSMVSSVIDGGWQGFAIEGLNFPGVSRFQALAPEIPASLATDGDSDPAWSTSTEDAEISVGPLGVTVTPNGASLVTVDLDLGRCDAAPDLYPHQANRVDLDYEDCSATVYWVSADDGSLALPEGTGTKILPRRRTATYAGSWAQDFGLGEILDAGSDDLAAGKSSLMAADYERVASFLLPAAGAAAILRFVVVPDDPDGTCLIKHPLFRKPDLPPTAVHETGAVSTLLWPSGPAFRFGSRTWYDPDTESLVVPPVPASPATKSSVLTALMEYRTQLLGQSAELGTMVTDRYDAIEIGADSEVKAAGTNTLSFLLPCSAAAPKIALVNKCGECPPIPCFPAKARDGDWEATGEYCAKVYLLAKEPRPLITAGNSGAGIFDPGGSEWTSASAISVAGWSIREHSHPLDGTEDGFTVKLGGVAYATLRPYRGFAWSPLAVAISGGVHLCEASRLQLAAVLTSDAGIAFRRFGGGATEFSSDVLESDSVGSAQIARHPSGSLVIAYEEDGQVKAVRSTSHGSTWSEPEMIGNGTNPAPAIDRKNGVEYCAAWVDPEYRLYRRLGKVADWEDAGPICEAPEGRAGLEISPSSRRELVFALRNEDGSLSRWISTNQGDSWTEE